MDSYDIEEGLEVLVSGVRDLAEGIVPSDYRFRPVMEKLLPALEGAQSLVKAIREVETELPGIQTRLRDLENHVAELTVRKAKIEP